MTSSKQCSLRVVIVGAGISGLACAIAFRQRGINVTVLERKPEFRPVGAGIRLPANATRAMRALGLYERLKDHGAVVVQNHVMRAYDSGRVLACKTAGGEMTELYGSEWMVIHRTRYHSLLLEEAIRLGTDVRIGCEVLEVEAQPSITFVTLQDGRVVGGDVIIGADARVLPSGRWGRASPPGPDPA